MSYIDMLDEQLPVDEGRESHPYTDSKGKITIGIGRNLTDNGLSPGEIDFLFANDLRAAEDTARELISNFDQLSDVRKAVVMNMAFNLGYLRLSGFRNMLAAVRSSAWEIAAREMQASAWDQEVGQRAKRLEFMMRNNQLP